MIAYRYLTEADEASFCHKVTEALSKGWALYGSPIYAYDAETSDVQAGLGKITKSVSSVFSPPHICTCESWCKDSFVCCTRTHAFCQEIGLDSSPLRTTKGL